MVRKFYMKDRPSTYSDKSYIDIHISYIILYFDIGTLRYFNRLFFVLLRYTSKMLPSGTNLNKFILPDSFN